MTDGRHPLSDPQHVSACARCRRVVDLSRELVGERVADSAIDARSADIDALVARLCNMSPRDRVRAAQTDDNYALSAVARRFATLASQEVNDLTSALCHAEVATTLAARIGSLTGNHGELLFEAWKVRSTIHRERGEGGSARAALVYASAAVDLCADRELKRAIIDYADATICACRDTWEPEQAFALLNRCEPVFALRDPARCLHVRALRGVIHTHAGEHGAALAAFESVAADIDPADAGGVADARRNVADALISVGRIDEGEELVRAVREMDVALNRVRDVIKDDSLLAWVAEKRGDFAAAADGYADAAERFAAAGQLEAAVLEGKSCAVALVADGRVSEAAEVLRDVLSRVSADSDRRRFTAIAVSYLKGLAEADHLSLDVATFVRRYIDRIHVQRATPFVPPMSGLVM